MPTLKIRHEYLRKSFLLSRPDFSGLFITADRENILLKARASGDLQVYGINDSFKVRSLPGMSLRQLGEQYLKLGNQTTDHLLKYLIPPEMEVERILNCVRHTYLHAVLISNFKTPHEYLTAKYNRAFQSLAGLKVTQPLGTGQKDNDSFWKEAGFSPKAKELDWCSDFYALDRVIGIMKTDGIYDDVLSAYKELIAIKPGFHELLVHHDYFCRTPDGDTLRDQVFKMLRNKEHSSPVSVSKMPDDIDTLQYYRYAPCHVTEGPFVSRKDSLVSCFEEIRTIDLPCKIQLLQDKFHISNYYKASIDWDEIEMFRYYRHAC